MRTIGWGPTACGVWSGGRPSSGGVSALGLGNGSLGSHRGGRQSPGMLVSQAKAASTAGRLPPRASPRMAPGLPGRGLGCCAGFPSSRDAGRLCAFPRPTRVSSHQGLSCIGYGAPEGGKEEGKLGPQVPVDQALTAASNLGGVRLLDVAHGSLEPTTHRMVLAGLRGGRWNGRDDGSRNSGWGLRRKLRVFKVWRDGSVLAGDISTPCPYSWLFYREKYYLPYSWTHNLWT